jgi:Arc/MetJ family transcription regulator
MRTNIVLDDALINEAFAVTGIRSKKELVHRALQVLLQTEQDARRRADYHERIGDIQQKTSGLVLREKPHSLIRSDRDRQ